MREMEWPYVDLSSLVQYRVDRVDHVMKEEGLDAVILTTQDNIRYATDYSAIEYVECVFHGFNAIVLPGGDAYIYSYFHPGSMIKSPIEDKPNIKEIIGLPAVYPFWAISSIAAKLFVEKLQNIGVKRVGFDTITHDAYALLTQEMPSVEFKQVGWELLKARAIKGEEEIRLIEAGCTILDAAVKDGIELIREGKSTERQIAAVMVKKLIIIHK